jgi:hypothetical protein
MLYRLKFTKTFIYDTSPIMSLNSYQLIFFFFLRNATLIRIYLKNYVSHMYIHANAYREIKVNK